MNGSEPIARTHLVLVGSGHAHVTVIRALGMRPEPGLVVTCIAKELEAPYSGMLPGLVAGHYTDDQCHIDVVRLCNWAGVRLIHGVATRVDRDARRVEIEGRAPLAYDFLSIDVGITPLLDGIEGAAEHALAVKPISTFMPRWRKLEAAALTPKGPRRIAVIGSGAAGFELVLAARYRLLGAAASAGLDPAAFQFTLIGTELLPSHNARARALARRELGRQGVELIEGEMAAAIHSDHVRLAGGRKIPADAVMASTRAGAAPWFKSSGLPVDGHGFLAVRPTLQLLDDDDIFAVGDCAHVLEHPREKAGVFAVRQGPPLTENLRRRAQGMAAEPFVPQKQFLTLLSTGGRHAIAARGKFIALSGAWIWRWKDRIDQEFMQAFNDLPTMAGASSEPEDMRCAGCAAKVGPVTLARALDRLAPSGHVSRDDAVIIEEGGPTHRLETIDFLRAFWPEPYVFGEIAAVHAMSDIFAMGGTPAHALANVVLPYAAPTRTEEDLYQLLAGARAALEREGATLLGGHSSEGAEMSAGFFVSGRVEPARILRKSGLRPGDRLILTRPLGTGVLFAALMRGAARSFAIDEALASMRTSNATAARTLAKHGATGLTDVTGFGLAGHLLEMLEASDASATLALPELPLYRTVLDLARQGIASTLLPENQRLASALDGALDPSTLAVVFDPQTSGGMLAGIPAVRADQCLSALHAAGITKARIIGDVLDAAPAQPRLRFTGTL